MPTILIVDDSTSKIQSIESYLKSCGISEGDIDYAASVTEAKSYLKSKKYNILLVDLVLPIRAGQETSNASGIRLVEEICSRGRYYEPDIIVAISAYTDAASEFEGKFSKYTAKVINYSETNLNWQNDIDEILAECDRRSKKGTFKAEFDISFICALEDEEYQLINVLKCQNDFYISPSGLRYKKGTINIGDVAISYTVTCINSAGPVASSSHSTRVILDFHPRLLIMTGICAGIDERVQLGDILVALSAWDWQTGKFATVDGSSIFKIEPNMIQCSDMAESTVIDFIKQGYNGDIIKENWHGDMIRTAPMAFCGPIASGSSVVASKEKINEIKDNQHRKVIGLEMESYGLYYACRQSSHRPLDYLMIKGVSDRADLQKNDSFRHYASYTSAQFALQYITHTWVNVFSE